MSFKSSLSCLILAMTTCLFFPNSLCCDVKDALDVRSQFLIVSRRNRNQALKSSMPNLDFRRQSCFTDNSHDIITLHTIGKVCQSKEIVGNLEDFALGTVFKLSSACFRISPSTDYALNSSRMTSIAILYLETTTMLQSRIVKRAKCCNPAARTPSRSETSVLRQHGYLLFSQLNQYLHLGLSCTLGHYWICSNFQWDSIWPGFNVIPHVSALMEHWFKGLLMKRGYRLTPSGSWWWQLWRCDEGRPRRRMGMKENVSEFKWRKWWRKTVG